jgi:hypothetical protein
LPAATRLEVSRYCMPLTSVPHPALTIRQSLHANPSPHLSNTATPAGYSTVTRNPRNALAPNAPSTRLSIHCYMNSWKLASGRTANQAGPLS